MASRLGIRLATRSLRQPVVLTSRTQVGRRVMSSGTPKQSSDAPWIAIAGVITVGGLAATFGGGDSKAAHHAIASASKSKDSPKEESKEESKQEKPSKKDEAPKSDDSKSTDDNVEGSVSPDEVKESIEKSVKADDPSTAKAEEAKSTGSLKKDSNSGSESGDDDFVKIEKISTKDTQDALAQSQASGVTVNPQCVSDYQDLKIKKTSKFITFKLSDDMKEIVVDKISADEDYEAFLKALPPAEPRWAVYDVAFEKDGGKRNKLAFFSWSPDDAKVKAKMVYASSRDALRRSLDGIAAEIQATAPDEVAWESVLEKVSRGR
ncbi:cofilin/tropomyosin-type actin-binding protein [Rhizoctonia solani 123E]|uniref:Cofilin n=1 Tax=Rhizoctonia solani 123E TaxID=1423351 RepID=A0A074SVW1_9AGAM|nr:cofilin/tropomyosin-type actin-binding protein [Rhizoctonia solani 123E]